MTAPEPQPSPDSSPDDDGTTECEGHGRQPTALVCMHLVEADYGESGLGFNWSAEDGDYVANCDECELECDDEGFFPDDLVEDTFVVICKVCLDEIAKVHGVTMEPPDASSRQS